MRRRERRSALSVEFVVVSRCNYRESGFGLSEQRCWVDIHGAGQLRNAIDRRGHLRVLDSADIHLRQLRMFAKHFLRPPVLLAKATHVSGEAFPYRNFTSIQWHARSIALRALELYKLSFIY